MNVSEVVHELATYEIRVHVHGDRVLIEGPEEALTDKTVDLLREWKSDLLALYDQHIHGISFAEIRELAGPDWSLIQSDYELQWAFAYAVWKRRMRECGEVPPGYTKAAVCAGCGTVRLWEGCPTEVLACPWCWNRLRGRPVPKI